ncbi:MAG: peptide chain release factor N(5)-glutamine methyltransferase [Anaerosomatales bacterium]|nr:peptide chain release factor N(5)-glutamine methyltransferase [Anaerosomatales bacterium]
MAERVWNVKDALEWTAGFLESKGDESPRVAAEWLLSAATGLTRVELYAYHDRPLSPQERARYRELVARRAEGMPLQYVTGEMPFRHLVVHVEPGVFIPRPETEVLVDEALAAVDALAEKGAPLVVDLCTGSGCVAVSIAYERERACVHATDVSAAAVEAARRNALHAGVDNRVQVVHGDLFEPLPRDRAGHVDVIVSNPPYIPSADLPDLPAEVLGFEPGAALDGGPDGLSVARRIWDEATRWLRPGGTLALELDAGRVRDAAREIGEAYTDVRVREDLTGRDRILVARKREAMES